MSALVSTGRVVLALLAALFGVASTGAFLGAATVTDRLPLFLLAGLAAFCAAYLLGLLLVTRRAGPDQRRRVPAVWFCAGTALVAGAFAWTALLPMEDPRLPPAPTAGQRFWELLTGSRVAYVHVPAEVRARPTPIIFLCGGPGIPGMKGDSEYFGELAREGFHVYVYDMVGCGRSARLADPRDYTLERDVSELEAIRKDIGT